MCPQCPHTISSKAPHPQKDECAVRTKLNQIAWKLYYLVDHLVSASPCFIQLKTNLQGDKSMFVRLVGQGIICISLEPIKIISLLILLAASIQNHLKILPHDSKLMGYQSFKAWKTSWRNRWLLKTHWRSDHVTTLIIIRPPIQYETNNAHLAPVH